MGKSSGRSEKKSDSGEKKTREKKLSSFGPWFLVDGGGHFSPGNWKGWATIGVMFLILIIIIVVSPSPSGH